MTIKTNYLQGLGYNAIDLVNEFDALFTDGVIAGLSVSQNGSPNLSVNVAIGSGIKTGLFLNNDGIVNLLIVGNPSGYNRIDVVYADMDNNIFGVQQGIANSAPTAPTLSGNKIALSQVAVGNGVGVINTANLTDLRVNAEMANGAKSFIANGYLKLPNGFILQWGGITLPADTSSHGYTFPIVFPTSCLVALPTIWDSTNASGSSACRLISFSTATINVANSLTTSMKATFIAIGY